MAKTSDWPKMEMCKKHPEYVGSLKYGFGKPKLNSCPECEKETGDEVQVIVDPDTGKITGPKDV